MTASGSTDSRDELSTVTTTMPRTETLQWNGDVDGSLTLIDQTRLPVDLVLIECADVDMVWEAIKSLRVRGAPAIGIAAAYGICLGIRTVDARDAETFFARLEKVANYLESSRPTAVNLFWAIERMKRCAFELRDTGAPVAEIRAALLSEAKQIHEEDRQMCHAIGRHGADLLEPGSGVLTHCNAGGLATAEYGTALAVLFSAHDQGKQINVYVDETRPLLQGARLTTWELTQHDVPTTLICDSMAAHVMAEGRIQAVVTGADRIAANGDTANKIGTYGLAVLARAHSIPFYVAAPSSTFDLSLPSGEAIPIEVRGAAEITHGFGRQTAPDDVAVYNPAFDVTPAPLISAIITEQGIIQPVTAENIAATVQSMT